MGCAVRIQMQGVMGEKCGTREERLVHRVLLLVRQPEGKGHLDDEPRWEKI